jgi:hypothetical protein
MVVGATFGVLLGLFVAIFSREGFWPEVWAGLICAFALSGAFVGVIEWFLK